MSPPTRRVARAAGLPAEGGFTLLEVLVALAVLSLALAVLLPSVTDSIGRARRGERISGARIVAAELLDRVGVDLPLRIGETEGMTGIYRWRVAIAPGRTLSEPSPALPRVITLEVSWPDLRGRRSLTVRTMRLQARSERTAPPTAPSARP